MKTMQITLMMLLGMMVALVGCKSDREEVAEDTIEVWEDVVDEMKGVKSNSDLVDAKPKLEKLGARLKDEMKKMQAMGDGTAAEKAEIEKEYKPRMEKVMAQMMDEAKRLEKDLGPTGPMDFFAALKVEPMDMRMK